MYDHAPPCVGSSISRRSRIVNCWRVRFWDALRSFPACQRAHPRKPRHDVRHCGVLFLPRALLHQLHKRGQLLHLLGAPPVLQQTGTAGGVSSVRFLDLENPVRLLAVRLAEVVIASVSVRADHRRSNSILSASIIRASCASAAASRFGGLFIRPQAGLLYLTVQPCVRNSARRAKVFPVFRCPSIHWQ